MHPHGDSQPETEFLRGVPTLPAKPCRRFIDGKLWWTRAGFPGQFLSEAGID